MSRFRRFVRPSRLPWLALPLLIAIALTQGNQPATHSAEPSRRFLDPHPDLPAHLARLGVDQWHAAGINGKFVKVAVLDSGFRGYREFLGHALPADVRCRSFRHDGDLEARDSRHGILCAEVIYSVAPGAELLLANWQPDDTESFLRAVRWAKDQGADVISCSVVMPGWSDGEGGGSVHRELERIIGDGTRPGDPLFVASAGNLALRHWAGEYRPGVGGWHQWSPGVIDNPLSPWGDRPVSVEWSAPAGRDCDYEFAVVDAKTGGRVGELLPLPADGFPGRSLSFTPEPDREYFLRLRVRGGEGGCLRVVALGAGMGRNTPRGSIAFPGDGRSVLAVGAVDDEGVRAAYSACGPDTSAVKPELVAPVPFPSRWREAPFSGTSASAPQVAGLAALLMSEHPDWNAKRVRAELCRHGRDLGRPGADPETGHGLAGLPGLLSLSRR